MKNHTLEHLDKTLLEEKEEKEKESRKGPSSKGFNTGKKSRDK
jgi:hypothetical protein